MIDRCDVLVLGGGLAGLRSAVSAAQSGARVCLAVKGQLCSGASFYPGMEMVACQSSDGTAEGDAAWLEEILRTSRGLASREMNAIYIRNIADAVARMGEIGIDHPRRTEPKVACFAERARPTYAWGGWPAIRDAARQRLQELGIRVLEHTQLLAFLRDGQRVQGAALLGPDGPVAMAAGSVVLATGGFGGLYRDNLNPPDVSGQGQALALLAGASLVNVEFIQFIPGFLQPAYKTVFREMSIPYVRSLTLSDGSPLLTGPDAGECLRLRAGHGPFSCETRSREFDLSIMRAIGRGERGARVRYDPAILGDSSAFIRPYVTWLKAEKGVDIAREEICIAPFYHACNGGVRIGPDCATRLPGLYACGEVSGGIHGADRQGGMSTGSCLVFGDIAGRSAARFAREHTPKTLSEAALRDCASDVYGAKGAPGDPVAVLNRVRDWMSAHAAILRSAEGLAGARARIAEMAAQFRPGLRVLEPDGGPWAQAWCALILADAVLCAMENRRESRGAHYREDYPDRDDARFARRFEVWREKERAVARLEQAQ